VNDILAGEIIALCDLGFSRLTSVEGFAFLQELWPGSPVNGTVYTAAT
jgi:hypothetical protein